MRRPMPSSKACMCTTPPFGEAFLALRRGGIDWRRSLTYNACKGLLFKPAQASPQLGLGLETSAQRRGARSLGSMLTVTKDSRLLLHLTQPSSRAGGTSGLLTPRPLRRRGRRAQRSWPLLRISRRTLTRPLYVAGLSCCAPLSLPFWSPLA